MKTRHLSHITAFISLAISPSAFSQIGGAADPPVADVPSPSERADARMEIPTLVAVIKPVGKSNVSGTVVFERTAEGVKVTAKIGGLSPESHHAFHIHEFGDLRSDDASSAGVPVLSVL